jgi:hypothetical protein
MSLWFRTPHDMKGLRAMIQIRADDPFADAHQEDEVLSTVQVADLQMKFLRYVIDDRERGEMLVNMDWRVRKMSNRRQLWVSDWPLDVPKQLAWLGHPSSFVTLPIAPDTLFVAAGSQSMGDRLAALTDREIISRQNRATVGHARSFVGAQRPDGADFIEKHFGGLSRYSVTQDIASRYRAAKG